MVEPLRIFFACQAGALSRNRPLELVRNSRKSSHQIKQLRWVGEINRAPAAIRYGTILSSRKRWSSRRNIASVSTNSRKP